MYSVRKPYLVVIRPRVRINKAPRKDRYRTPD